eukprot:6205608-Pleurochrysis_carterae.AAC.1
MPTRLGAGASAAGQIVPRSHGLQFAFRQPATLEQLLRCNREEEEEEDEEDEDDDESASVCEVRTCSVTRVDSLRMHAYAKPASFPPHPRRGRHPSAAPAAVPRFHRALGGWGCCARAEHMQAQTR